MYIPRGDVPVNQGTSDPSTLVMDVTNPVLFSKFQVQLRHR
jgi:hypothetical protein